MEISIADLSFNCYVLTCAKTLNHFPRKIFVIQVRFAFGKPFLPLNRQAFLPAKYELACKHTAKNYYLVGSAGIEHCDYVCEHLNGNLSRFKL